MVFSKDKGNHNFPCVSCTPTFGHPELTQGIDLFPANSLKFWLQSLGGITLHWINEVASIHNSWTDIKSVQLFISSTASQVKLIIQW